MPDQGRGAAAGLGVHLQPLGAVGQIALIQANVRDERSMAEALRGADTAVNLVGILSSGAGSFRAMHAEARKGSPRRRVRKA